MEVIGMEEGSPVSAFFALFLLERCGLFFRDFRLDPDDCETIRQRYEQLGSGP